MVRISYRALAVVAALAGLTFAGEIPWWVLGLVTVHQIPGSYVFWLPGEKAKYTAAINKALDEQQQAALAQLRPTKPTDIN